MGPVPVRSKAPETRNKMMKRNLLETISYRPLVVPPGIPVGIPPVFFFLLNIALTTGISSQSEIHESFQQYLNNNIRKKNFKIILDIFEKRNIFAV